MSADNRSTIDAKSRALALEWGGFALVLLLAGGGHLPAQTSLSIGNTPGYPGTTVSVPVRVARATNIVGAQFDLSYNPSKTTPGALAMAPANAGHTVRSREIAPGVRRTVVYSMNNALLRTNGFSATLPFQMPAQERVGSGPITPSHVILAKRDATAITPVAGNSGAVFVRSVNPLPDGSVQFFLPSEADERYVIQATTDFFAWVSLTNITAAGEFMDLVDADAAAYPHRFYRWVAAKAAGQFGAVTLNPNGSIQFQLSGTTNRTYVLQASANLVTWADLRTNVATTGSIDFNVPVEAGYAHRFFRVKSR